MTYKIMKKILCIIMSIGVVLSAGSCKGFLDDTPTDSVPAPKASATLEDAGVAVNGLYTLLKYCNLYGGNMITMGDMRADNLYPKEVSGTGSIAYTLEYESSSNTYFELWKNYYATILRVNTLIANINGLNVTSDSDIAKKNNYLGEAYAVRALYYFDLARLYGMPYLYDKGASLGAVIVTKPVAPSEAKLPRSTVAETYAQVASDLAAALPLLSTDKNLGHFNYWGAKLLQARMYLYMGNYAEAYTSAKEVITKSPYSLVPNADYLTSWGVEGNSESVLEVLVSTNGDIDGDAGFDGGFYNYLWFDDSNAGASVVPTLKWRKLFASTPNDVRAQMIQYDDPVTGVKKSGKYWLKKFIGNKTQGYTFRRNNPHILRLAEAYLIAAEAGVETGAADASSFLNAVRERADATATDVVATKALVDQENQKEFIGEGHRFFDIMRRGGSLSRSMVDDPNDFAGATPYTISWDDYRVALPISSTERATYKELQQNPGYKD